MNLIRQIQLPNGRTTTNLGFGCAGLLRLPTAGRRDQLLRTVVEEGITHFDVARMYGSGEAEGMVGASLRQVRDRITLGTKFGLPYAPPSRSSLGLQSVAKWLLNKSPALKNKIRSLRSKAGPVSAQAPAPNTYSIEEMDRSLGLSLAQLQTDRVDLFFLHAPGLHDIIAGEMAGGLQARKAEGKIGAFGISGHRAELDYFLKARPEVCGEAIQSHFSVLARGAEGDPLPYPYSGIFGVLDGPLERLHRFLAVRADVAKAWSDQLGIDLRVRENVGIVILAVALALNPQGMTLFFTSNPKRLKQTVRRLAENSFSVEALLAFRREAREGIDAN